MAKLRSELLVILIKLSILLLYHSTLNHLLAFQLVSRNHARPGMSDVLTARAITSGARFESLISFYSVIFPELGRYSA